MRTHYQVLGAYPGDGQAQLRAAYLRAAALHHPDAGGLVDEFVRVQEAWSILRVPHARHDYDALLSLSLDRCHGCGGDGFTVRGFKQRLVVACTACGGAGFLERSSP